MTTRKQILEMLAAGEIDVTRATEMLGETRGEGSVPEPPESPAAAVPPVPPLPVAPPTPRRADNRTEKRQGRWLHIHVSNLETGHNRVKVNVPLGLVKFGLKVGSHFSDDVDEDMMDDVLEALHNNETSGTLVEVENEDENERVHIFVD